MCCDCRRQVRSQALTYLQRALLVHDLQTLSAVEWESCFNKVLFPLLQRLLEVNNDQDPQGIEETRMRASTLLCKVSLLNYYPQGVKFSADPRNSAFLVSPEIRVNLERKLKGCMGGGYLTNNVAHRNGSPIKICRISQGNVWQPYLNCVSNRNNYKFKESIHKIRCFGALKNTLRCFSA